MKKKNNKLYEFAFLAILVALTVVLQTLGAVFPLKVAGISISLVMVPLTVAVCFFGFKGGLVIGTAFGLTVFVHSILGLDAAGATILAMNPFFTFVITAVRGAGAGLLASVAYKAFSRFCPQWLSYVLTGFCATLSNTALFVLCYWTLFGDMLRAGAESSGYADNVFGFVIFALVGINFVVEVITTVLLAPPVCKALEKQFSK